MDNPVAANVLGTAGAVCWSVQLIPQIVVNYRRHHTTGLQPSMMLLWATAGIPLGVYNILQNFNIALQIQPQILSVLSLTTWAQCRYYRDGIEDPLRWNLWKCCFVVFIMGTLMGGIEVALYLGLKEAVEQGIHWPSVFMAVLAAVLLCAGVLRHYWDIYKERTVRGISFLFVAIDAIGDLTSLISVFFQPKLDILGMVIYGSELVLWLGIIACGGWFNLRPWIKALKQSMSENPHITPGRHTSHGNGIPVDMSTASQHDDHDASSISSTSSSSVFRTASRELRSQERAISAVRLRARTAV